MSEDEVRALAELKQRLERRIRQLEEELDLLRACVRLIDSQLAKMSFRPAIEEVAVEEEPPEREFKLVSRSTGRPLARMYVWRDKLKIVPEEGVEIDVNRPPFSTFFVRRVLDELRERDLEEARAGRLDPDKVLRYEIKDEDGKLRELVVYNYRDEIRLREIRNSARWTFERMVERRP